MNNHIFSRARFFCLLLVAVSILALAGCGDKEPEQRRAFIAFLENKVLGQRGIKLTELSRSEKKMFGDYAGHYALLARFQKNMAESTAKNARDLLALSEYDSLAALAKASRSLGKASREAEKLREIVLNLKVKADGAKAKLQQPEDLARVYDAAYEKVVVFPAKASAATFESVRAALAETMILLDFINTHSKDMEIDGKSINVKNPGLMEELNAKMTAASEKAAALQVAYAVMVKALSSE